MVRWAMGSPIRANLVPHVRLTVLGVVVALFFQCMSGLLYPIRPTTKGIQWGLVVHTVAMFSFLTIGVGINRDVFSISYIDGREFPGDEILLPGPCGYETFVYVTYGAISIVSGLMFPFNQWLADGLLVSSVSNSVVQCLT